MPRNSARSRSSRPSLTVIAAIAVVATAVVGGGVLIAVTAAERAGQTATADRIGAPSRGDSSGPLTSGPLTSGLLHADTRMGAVSLTVAELPAMRSFYADAVGLEVIAESESEVSLGQGGETLIRLVHDAAAPARGGSDAGLYHSAILFPDSASLAASLAQVAERAPASYQGSADHRVSLAFYLGDPEGNGVELYVDRPSNEWEWVNGRVTMGSGALDPNQFIADNLDESTPASAATLGHVHLSVGDLDAARAFYVDTLGFDITSESTGALFMSAGGYHHHLAANTWNSAGAGARAATQGLREFTVILADGAELDAAAARLADAGVPTEHADGSLTTEDPWGNTVRLLDAGSLPDNVG